MIELSINIKNSETKMSERHLCDTMEISNKSPDLLKLVEDAIVKFKAASDVNDSDYEIVIKSKLVWQR